MVYTGKPSRGCQTCRARRIKCDEAKPTCNQCAKSRRQCAGYRPEFEIIHRDETKATQSRVRKQLARAAAAAATSGASFDDGGLNGSGFRSSDPLISPNSDSQGSSLPSSGDRPAVSLPHGKRGRWSCTGAARSLARAPRVSLEQQCANYFAANFILVPRIAGTVVGYMEYLLPLLETETLDSALRHAFNACAAAALGNRRNENRADCAALALHEQSMALAKTFSALQDPVACRSDGTLAAVLLLTLYESIVADQQVGLLAWRSHVEGAVRIVTSRGRQQLKSRIGRGLFNAVRMQMISRLLSSGVAPALSSDWWMDDNTSMDPINARVQRFGLKVAELRAEASRLMVSLPRTPANVDLMLEMLRRIQAFDQELAGWMRTMPDEYWYKTSYWEQAPLDFGFGDMTALYGSMPVFPGRVDTYPSFLVSAVWNVARVCRLILSSLVIRAAAWVCAPVDYRTTAEYATARRICETIITDIVASVPYHLGWSSSGSGIDESSAGFACGRGDDEDEDHAPIKALPALMVIWPLTCMNSHDCSTPEQKAWAAGRLTFISEELGIKNARWLATHRFPFPSSLIRQDGLMTSPDVLTLRNNLVISTKKEAFATSGPPLAIHAD